MVIPVGSLINAGAVALGAGLGLAAGGFVGERLRDSLYQVLGLCTIIIGLNMTLGAENFLVVILSCVLGVVTGEAVGLAALLAALGDKLKSLVRSGNERFTEGLVTASLMICVGAMGLVGSLEEGLGGGRATLISKSVLDFTVAMMLATVYGSGVAWAAVPVLVYQGGLTILAGFLAPFLTEGLREALVSTGGVLIVGIGFNLLGVKPISIENLLPSLLYAVVLGLLLV